MSPPPSPQLPDAVRQALQRGNLFDAIKLMRQSGVTNLAELRAVLEAEARRINAGKPPGAAAPAPAAAASGGRAPKPRPPKAAPASAEPGTSALMRPATVEDLTPRNGLSPGEVPRSNDLAWWLLIIAVIAGGLLLHLWRRAGAV